MPSPSLFLRSFSFIATVIAAVLTPAPALAQNSPEAVQDAGVFQQFADSAWAAVDAGLRWADRSNKRRLARFLNGIDQPLTALRREKFALWEAVRKTNCAAVATTPAVLSSARARVQPLMGKIEANSRTLETAVRPTGFREAVREFADGLDRLQRDKGWIVRVERYCEFSPPKRNEIRNDVGHSLEAVRKAQVSLDRLIEGLNRL
jgi:hypothetical protein